MKYLPLRKNLDLLRCPLCGQALSFSNGSLICGNRHCYDISKKGYVNFLTSSKKTPYQKVLFENRAAVFRAGCYRAVLDELEAILTRYAPPGAVVLDVGCGEGYYASALQQNGRRVLGLDNVKEAIGLASRGQPDVGWMVADLSHIPLRSGCVDVLLNFLTPANYGEFLRLLAPDGIVVKAVPGAGYLQEIRQAVSAQLRHKSHDNQAVAAHFDRHMDRIETRRVVRTYPVSPDLAEAFLHMTPMTFHIDTNAVDIANLHAMTIDLVLLVGRKQK